MKAMTNVQMGNQDPPSVTSNVTVNSTSTTDPATTKIDADKAVHLIFQNVSRLSLSLYRNCTPMILS